uniref:Uncharacterized protein n=1 Tax=Rhizophora mucronata TaxID=61149 RepID=A0A2P2QBC0_RHIMU
MIRTACVKTLLLLRNKESIFLSPFPTCNFPCFIEYCLLYLATW